MYMCVIRDFTGFLNTIFHRECTGPRVAGCSSNVIICKSRANSYTQPALSRTRFIWCIYMYVGQKKKQSETRLTCHRVMQTLACVTTRLLKWCEAVMTPLVAATRGHERGASRKGETRCPEVEVVVKPQATRRPIVCLSWLPLDFHIAWLDREIMHHQVLLFTRLSARAYTVTIQ